MLTARALLRASIIQCLAAAAQGQARDTGAVRPLAPGVTHQQVIDPRGPFVIHIVRVDLRRRDVALQHARALDQFKGRERTTDMVRRATNGGATVLAAINADFFSLATGENENNQVIAGEWWKGLKVTDSPYDTYDNIHSQLAIDAAGRPRLDRFMLDGTAWAHGTPTPIITLNFNPMGNPEGTAFYTSRFGATTPRDTTRQTAEARLDSVGRRGDTLVYVRHGAVAASSGSAIPAHGAVLAAYGAGARQREVQAMADGDTVKVLLATLPRLPGSPAPSLIIGGWPRILRDGAIVATEAITVEGTISRNAEARHPRSAVGVSRDGNTMLLVTVDGRSTRSVGMTLVELATLMRRLGAWQAMNFDGGGSTTMVIGGAVVNVPSDSAGERAVGNALFVMKKR